MDDEDKYIEISISEYERMTQTIERLMAELNSLTIQYEELRTKYSILKHDTMLREHLKG